MVSIKKGSTHCENAPKQVNVYYNFDGNALQPKVQFQDPNR